MIRGARQLVTLRGSNAPRSGRLAGELAIIPDGAVLIEGESIREVGPGRRVTNLEAARTAEEFDAAGCVVMPGFVDSHTHLVSGPQGKAVGAIPGGRLAHSARRLAETAVRHGTTTLEAKTGCGGDARGELKSLRALKDLVGVPLDILPTVLAGRCMPPAWSGNSSEYLEWFAWELLPKVYRRKLARFVDIDNAAGFVEEDVERFYQSALALGFDIRLHGGGTELALRLGARSIDVSSPVQARALAGSDVVATLLPMEAFFRGDSPSGAARELVEAGIPLAVASGFDRAGCASLSMPAAVALAYRMFGLTPAEAIAAATINAAHALGVAWAVGSIECGKLADLVVLDISDYRDLASALGVNPVAAVIKRGRVVYKRSSIEGRKDEPAGY